MELQGVSIFLAWKMIGEVGDVRRFRSADDCASYTDAASLNTSSGDNLQQRLKPGGDRRLNSMLRIMAVCLIQHEDPGRDYKLKKIKEGGNPHVARKVLRRRLCNVIYRSMLNGFSPSATSHLSTERLSQTGHGRH